MPPIIIVLVSVLSALLIFLLLFLFLIAPRVTKRGEFEKFLGRRYAHRGLHDKNVPENSLGAFRRAVECGYGIELDVRLSSEGELVVFHDDTLERMTVESGRVDTKTLRELKEIYLSDSDEKIPSFTEVLSLVAGRVPLIIEIKEDAGSLAVTRRLAEVISDYEGEYIIESFNPLAIGEYILIL